jgi:hypothetical protein
MKELIKILPVILNLLVGFISFKMAIKCLLNKKFLPFHEKAAGKLWDEIEYFLQELILSIIRITGLGFLIISLLLIICPVVNYFVPNMFYGYLIPIIALIFSVGLFIINLNLSMKSKANTPWKGSLYASVVILISIIISIFS